MEDEEILGVIWIFFGLLIIHLWFITYVFTQNFVCFIIAGLMLIHLLYLEKKYSFWGRTVEGLESEQKVHYLPLEYRRKGG